MKQVDIKNIQEAGESQRLIPGGYICTITAVEDVPDKEYLRISFDIADGDFKGYATDSAKRLGSWPYDCQYIRSYKPAALPFFKRMCTAISKSNGNFIFDGGTVNSDEKTLIGKAVGLVLGEEEYIGNDGNLKTRVRVVGEHPVDNIKQGKFKVPPLKKLPDDDIPLNTPTISETSEPGGLPF